MATRASAVLEPVHLWRWSGIDEPAGLGNGERIGSGCLGAPERAVALSKTIKLVGGSTVSATIAHK